MKEIYFKENLTRFREAKGMTKAELAERLGVSDTMVSFWESGKNEPRMGKIQMISEVLDINVDELLFQSPPKSIEESVEGFFNHLSENKRRAIEQIIGMDEEEVELFLKLMARKN
ncbi:helix-turn-helix transcriptional regulator [Paenibacillus polymyxa]|uniref:helix-turn-helix domain-containing protein n=1 Tax=Paenibacillus polymyxa TaxID=1406 RepID=UPI002024CFA1|nr:helix-turn-helix transcriptional regulator [Paenibacillus polymyxa]URJ36551.3 helix-turn-helix transcriptional regulator [Paenibacillus polymyxa]